MLIIIVRDVNREISFHADKSLKLLGKPIIFRIDMPLPPIRQKYFHRFRTGAQPPIKMRKQPESKSLSAGYFDMFDQTPIAYVAFNDCGLILKANIAAEMLFGIARSALSMQPLTQFIHPEDMDIYNRHHRLLVEMGSLPTCEVRILRSEKPPLWVRIDSIKAANQRIVSEFLVRITDITEKKQVEDAQLFLFQCGFTEPGADFFQSLAAYLAHSIEMDYVCIDRLEGEGLTARTVAVYFDGRFEDNVTYALKDTPCGDVVGKTICRFEKDVRKLFPRDLILQQMEAESYMGTTLWSFDGKPIGLIAVISRKPIENTHIAESVLKMASLRAAGEMERQEVFDSLKENEIRLQQVNSSLEDRVKKRTLELTRNNIHLQREIQERIQTENALKESEERYRSVFNNNHANMLIIDPETLDIVDANPAACSFYGYTCEELTANKLTYISKAHFDELKKKSMLALVGEQNHFYSVHQLCNGTTRDVELYVGVITTRNKPFLLSVIHDISVQRQAEQRNIEFSEFMQKLFDVSPLGIMAYETSGDCIMVNNAALKIIGASREFVLQQNFNRIESWKKSGLLAAAYEVIQSQHLYENLELNIDTADGRNVVLNCSLIPFFSAGKPHLLLMGQDVSRQKLSEEALRHNQKLSAIGMLIAGIVHEINNPNGFIIFNLPILRDYLEEVILIVDSYMAEHSDIRIFNRTYPDFRQDLFKLLENIENGAHRIDTTVSKLKDFSKKPEEIKLRHVDLKQVIDHAVSICRSEIVKNVKTFNLVVPEQTPPILTDPDAVEHIIVNILINAIHASDKTDSWISMRVSPEGVRPDRYLIEIEDNGCGMDEYTMKRIFDPFFTRKTTVQGTGLGLYICQSLVKGLGGEIEVTSRVGQGSSFKVILNNL